MKPTRQSGLDRLSSLDIKRTNTDYLVMVNLIKSLSCAIATYGKGHVFDIGCGNKPYESLFKNKESYTGSDIIQSSDNKVDIISSADNIPVNDNQYDTVISTQTIEHIYNHRGLVSEANRILRPKGFFIVSGPMYWPLHEEPHDFFRFTKYGFEELLKENGFKIVEILPNGGKWALFGQVFFQTVPKWVYKPKIMKIFFNNLFERLDNRYPDYSTTLNYVVVGQKI